MPTLRDKSTDNSPEDGKLRRTPRQEEGKVRRTPIQETTPRNNKVSVYSNENLSSQCVGLDVLTMDPTL